MEAYGTSAFSPSVVAVGVGVAFVFGFTGPELAGPHPIEAARRLQRRSKASKLPDRIKLLYDNARPPIELARRVKKRHPVVDSTQNQTITIQKLGRQRRNSHLPKLKTRTSQLGHLERDAVLNASHWAEDRLSVRRL